MRGKVEKFLPKIKQRLSLRYNLIDCVAGESGQESEEIANKNASKYDIILSLGGDGTLHNVVNGVLKSNANPIVGVLPFGTCNDVATTLKMPKNLDKAIDAVLRLNTTLYDIAFDGTNYMVYSLAGGYLTDIPYKTKGKTKRKLGRFAYVLYGIKNMFKSNPLPLTITADGESFDGKFNFIMLINSIYSGGFKLNAGEDLHNNKIKLVLIKKSKGMASLFEFARLFMFGIKNVKKCKNTIIKDVSNIEIINHSNSAFSFDGEKEKFLKKTLKVKQALKFITN